MKQMRNSFFPALSGVMMLFGPLSAAELISNGGFETGLTGWSLANQTGGDGTFGSQSGTSSPVTGRTVPAPPGGVNAAMSDGTGPGSHVLYQDFVVPPAGPYTATLSFSLLLNNLADRYATPADLDFGGVALNQQARVDIATSSSTPFSLSVSDVLLNVYQTQVGDPLVAGYDTISADLTSLFQAHPGETLRLRFAEVDNVFIFNMGIDDVSLIVTPTVPETTTLVPLVAGLTAVAFGMRRRLHR